MRISQAIAEKILAAFKEHPDYTREQIAAVVGGSICTVTRMARKTGHVRLRNKEAYIVSLIRLHNDKSIKVIADLCGRAPGTVWYLMKKHGIKHESAQTGMKVDAHTKRALDYIRNHPDPQSISGNEVRGFFRNQSSKKASSARVNELRRMTGLPLKLPRYGAETTRALEYIRNQPDPQSVGGNELLGFFNNAKRNVAVMRVNYLRKMTGLPLRIK
jgi:hypothetical protein